MNNYKTRALALIFATTVSHLAFPASAGQNAKLITIDSQPMGAALQQVAATTGVDILFAPEAVQNFQSRPVREARTAGDAVDQIIRDLPLEAHSDQSGAIVIRTAAAETSAADASADEAAIASGVLETVTVTTQKRSENLQNVPVTVTAITNTTLASANISLVQNLARLTPGLVINRYASIVGAYVRGIGTRYSNPGLEATVGNYTDDLYSPRPFAAALDFVDIERVEVLKGPQGTLYGRNTAGGAIRIITKDPTDKFEGLADVSYGRFNDVRTDGVINIPLNDNVSTRFAVTYNRNDGYVKGLNVGHNWLDNDVVQASAKILVKASDNLKLKLWGTYGRKSDWSSGLINIFPDERNVGVALGGMRSPGFYISAANYPKNPSDIQKFNVWSVGLRGDLAFDTFTLSSITGYQYFKYSGAFDVDVTDLSFIAAQSPKTWTRALSQEVQAVSDNSKPLNWTVGIYYYNEKNYDSSVSFGGQYSGVSPFQDIQSPQTSGGRYLFTEDRPNVNSVAGYAQGNYRLTERWSVTAGGRYTWERKKLPYHIGMYVNLPPMPPTILINEPAQTLTFKKFTPKVGVEYRPNDQAMLYAQWSRGYKSGGFNLPVPASPSDQVQPETLDAFEAGWKTEFGKVRFNGAGYYYDYKNIQIARSNAATGGNVVQNAAAGEVYGIETDLLYAATDRLELGLTANLMHAKFTSFLGDALIANDTSAACLALGGPAVAASSTACRGFSTLRGVQFAGQPLPLAPTFTGNVRVQYKALEDSDMGSIVLTSLASYMGTFNWGAGPTYEKEKAYVLLSAGATWTSANGRYDVSVSGDNLTGEKYRTAVVRNTTGGYYVPGPPLWWRIKAAVHF